MAIWASRILVTMPVGMWLLKRISGMSYGTQLQGTFVPAVAAIGMGGTVLLARHFLLEPLSPALRLVPTILIGALAYLSILLLIGRDLVKQLVSFLGQTMQTRS
jgi:Na+-driven multidrug efflux pump